MIYPNPYLARGTLVPTEYVAVVADGDGVDRYITITRDGTRGEGWFAVIRADTYYVYRYLASEQDHPEHLAHMNGDLIWAYKQGTVFPTPEAALAAAQATVDTKLSEAYYAKYPHTPRLERTPSSA